MNSICIATYNGERYIEELLRSILCQIKADDEIIISDDGSTDKTLDVIASVADHRISVFRHKKTFLQQNFENALIHAKGDTIFLADQDDVWLPGKYEACIQALKQYDLVCTNSSMTDKNLNIINPDFFSIYNSGKGILKNICLSTYYGACMAFRRSVLQAALPLPPTKEIGHDLWLGLVAETIGNVKFIPTPYLLYRRHDATSTRAENIFKRSNRPLLQKIKTRLIITYYISQFKLRYAKRK